MAAILSCSQCVNYTLIVNVFPVFHTSCIFTGIFGASMFSVLKKTSFALASADNNAAMMVLVQMASSMEPERSPITTTGDSKGRLEKNECE